MKKNTFRNILNQAANPSRFLVMYKKLLRRIADKSGRHTKEENLDWLESNLSSIQHFASRLDPELWEESLDVSRTLKTHATKILEKIEYQLGGGGAYPFLYFLTRYLKPDCIVETGVAAGFSSAAFLLGIQANQRGTLFSSDFPYFRIPNPERYIGIIVEDALRENWHLFVDGDEVNLPKIVDAVDKIDIFHYDSDKSYSGRDFALATISNALSKQGIIIMDDIQDNPFFYDYIGGTKPESWTIFKYDNKYLGLIGHLP